MYHKFHFCTFLIFTYMVFSSTSICSSSSDEDAVSEEKEGNGFLAVVGDLLKEEPAQKKTELSPVSKVFIRHLQKSLPNLTNESLYRSSVIAKGAMMIIRSGLRMGFPHLRQEEEFNALCVKLETLFNWDLTTREFLKRFDSGKVTKTKVSSSGNVKDELKRIEEISRKIEKNVRLFIGKKDSERRPCVKLIAAFLN